MTKPTQAQIEAAAKAVEEAYKCYGTEFTTIAICALTAADKTKTQEAYSAGLEDGRAAADPAMRDFIRDAPLSEPNDGWAAEQDKRDEIIAGLQHHVQRLTKLLDDQLGTPCEQIRHAQEIVATIERCAQVVRDRAAQYDHQNNNQENALWNECMEIIDTIRALKDKL